MEATRTQGEARPHLSDPGKEARAEAGIPVVPVFDGYRALAIMGIVVLHLLGKSGVLYGYDDSWYAHLIWGTVGHAVDILFVVSGFVVFLPTVARAGRFGSIRAYALRRVARLFPAYWFVLATSIVLIALVDSVPAVTLPGFDDLAFHLVGLQGLAGLLVPGGGPVGFGINPPLWTLSVEVSFYIVLPLVASFFFRHPVIGLVAAALITVGWNWGFEHSSQVVSFFGGESTGLQNLKWLVMSTLQLPAWAFSFACGMAGARIYVWITTDGRAAEWRGRIRWLQAIALVCFLFFIYLAGTYTTEHPLLLVAELSRLDWWIALGYSGFLAALMVTTALGPEWARRPFANEPIRKLGDISYGIFLSHAIIIYYLASLTGLPVDGTIWAFLVWTVAVVPASILYGYLSARFLEQPIRRWARRFGRRAQPASK